MLSRKFQRRYLFTGKLILKTGLHIGSGWSVGGLSDKPIIRTVDGRPFVPGSSFKGAFRSTVEKLAATIGVSSCGLMENQGCIGAQGQEQRDFNKLRKDADWSDVQLMKELTKNLCSTCQLFGSPYTASAITFSDMLPPSDDKLADKMIQVRDGVAIDRDSEKAVDQLKFDYEVVAPAQTFELKIWLDDPSDLDVGLTCLGLNEFVSGFGFIGGNRSRGLGNCQIEGLTIYELDLTVDDADERAKRLKRYLLGRDDKEKMVMVRDVTQFLDKKITKLLQGGTHA